MPTEKRDQSQRRCSLRYDGSPDTRPFSSLYGSMYSTGSQNTTADWKRRQSSSYGRSNYNREDRKSSSRVESNCISRSDRGISATTSSRTVSLRKPRLRKTLSETYCMKDRFYDVEGRSRKKDRHLKENDDSNYSEDENAFVKEVPSSRRGEHMEGSGRRDFRRARTQPLRLKPNLSRRSSNFRMQLYRELNVVERNKVKKTFLHVQCRDFGLSERNRIREEPLPSKVSFSYPGERCHFERSKPIAMGSGQRFEDDDWEYTRTGPETEKDKSMYGGPESEDVFALDIGALS